MKFTALNTSQTDYAGQFHSSVELTSAHLRELKRKAFSSLETLGFPTTKNEEWKYTNLSELLKKNFNKPSAHSSLSLSDIKNFLPEESNAILLVFENGKLNKSLSHTENLPAGLTVGSISDYAEHPAVISRLGTIAKHNNESFVALNTALFQEGAFIFCDRKILVDKTIHLLFINDARVVPTVSHPRNFIFASSGSSIKISESYFSMKAENAAFCNPVTEIYVDENAAVEFVKNETENPEDFHIDYTSAALEKDSRLHIHTITSSGRIVRNNLRIELQGKNGAAYLNGLYVTTGETHVDNHTFVDHASPECFSNEYYKGVLDDKSHGVFNGKIFVRRDAQKTNAYQSNKNILLSDESGMSAKPQLEIYADDVKCSHGATTGQLDEEALFYLRTRGIGENESRALLTTAFAEEILDRITMEPVREKLRDLIHSKLKKGVE